MSATSLLCARVNFYRACRRNVKNAGQPLTLCFMRPAYMRPVVPSMGNTRFSCVGFWAKCYPEMEVRCQNARFRFMPCTEYGAAVRKKQGSCIHLPDGFGTGFSPDNSEKPFSGRFNIRISPELHQKIAKKAADAGVSLNNWVLTKLEQGVI